METDFKKLSTELRLFFSALLYLPHLFLFYNHRSSKVIEADTKRWLDIMGLKYKATKGFLCLLTYYPEFRNLFYYRVGMPGKLLNIICPKMSTLFITTDSIGEGLFIQHGFATIIAAKSIGKNCWINQQVTVGFSNKQDCPVIKDNVTINAGAKVIGGITVGNNSQVGANAVVVKDVPDNCVVVGVPAYIIKRDGIKVKEPL